MSSLNKVRGCAGIVAGLLMAASPLGHAEVRFPTKAVRIVVGFTPGGAADQTARIMAEKLAEKWKPHAVVVENVIGAGGNIGALNVYRSPPDGHTLLLVSNTHAINRVLYTETEFDITKDFAFPGMMTSSAIVIAVNPKAGVKTMPELVAKMEREKGEMNYLTCGAATAHHFAMELIKAELHTKAVHVPHRGCSPAVVDAVAGHVDTVVATMPTVLPFIKSGKLVPIAVTSARRSESAKDIPTVAESGIPALKNFSVENYYGLAAPAGTPKDVVAKIGSDVRQALESPDIRAKLSGAGLDVLLLDSEKSAELIKRDVASYGAAAKTAGIKAE
ncbi:MAG: tripartite tricarboxylate transporter substrate-binding protein [Pigmentiphaga sp.]|uniref:Bug family tripartite tricarboxylate transporter substrate binding protein n=1 Tax=Pigmentiphaga sp. TaxID=1977564 RepID=UPI0029A2D406|nr:tripartite tricarboxylate transporter substrate-binding protein [Pigmentiphaga sp.]MDX3907482.1 tripartite tricarboxylate transporter substrate-binding protein [Pigmentiphaga sp.]